jgi:hypothetical protein
VRHFKLSLFNKLLGFLLLCLVCSGVVAVVLIRGQMTHLAYDQMRAVTPWTLTSTPPWLTKPLGA